MTTANIARVTLLFKDQKAADTVRRQLNDLGSKINVSFQPVFLSKKLEDELKTTEQKPSIIARNSEPLPPAKPDETLPYALILFIGKCMEMIV